MPRSVPVLAHYLLSFGTPTRWRRCTNAANLRRLEGLSEYDVRRPMTPSGTNLLGVMNGYLGGTLGRTLPLEVPGDDDLPNNGDTWACADEPREFILDWFRIACAHADETIEALDLDSPGVVPHWPEGHQATTLAEMITRVLGEEARHGGQLDIVAELIDGRADHNNRDARDWQAYVDNLQAVAEGLK